MDVAEIGVMSVLNSSWADGEPLLPVEEPPSLVMYVPWKESEPVAGSAAETSGVPALVHPSVVHTSENVPDSVGIFTMNVSVPVMKRYYPE